VKTHDTCNGQRRQRWNRRPHSRQMTYSTVLKIKLRCVYVKLLTSWSQQRYVLTLSDVLLIYDGVYALAPAVEGTSCCCCCCYVTDYWSCYDECSTLKSSKYLRPLKTFCVNQSINHTPTFWSSVKVIGSLLMFYHVLWRNGELDQTQTHWLIFYILCRMHVDYL